MSKSRRQFLTYTSLGLLGTAGACRDKEQKPAALPPGAPPAFGTAPAVGPEVSPSTFAEAEKLVQVQMNNVERNVAAGSWRRTMAAIYERRTGPRKAALEPSLAPLSHWDPVLPGRKAGPERDRFVRSSTDPGPLPANNEDLAFAPLTKLSRWIEGRRVSSEKLTRLYLERLERLNPKLRPRSRNSRSAAEWISSRSRFLMPGPICCVKPGSCRLWILFKPTDSGAGWPRRWPASSPR